MRWCTLYIKDGIINKMVIRQEGWQIVKEMIQDKLAFPSHQYQQQDFRFGTSVIRSVAQRPFPCLGDWALV